MLALGLAFLSGVSWGVADFLGGLMSRRLPVLNVILGTMTAGLVLIALVVMVRAEGIPAGDWVIFAALSAVAGTTGLASFYRGLAIGNMAVVAPISATAGVIPLVIGVAGGDRPSALAWAGLVLALIGVVLASREEVGEGKVRPALASGAGLAIVSAVGFGFFFVTMDKASDGDILWAVFINRVTAVALLAAVVLAIRPGFKAGSADLPVIALIGALDISANLLFAVASTKGLVSLVAVLGSLYPLTTIALARLVLGERPHRLAQVGVAAALTGVVLIAVG